MCNTQRDIPLVLLHAGSHTIDHVVPVDRRGDHVEGGGQSLRGDVVGVSACPLLLVRRNGQDHRDAVGDFKAFLLAGILQATDDVRCPALRFELLGDVGVQDNQTHCITSVHAGGAIRVLCNEALSVELRRQNNVTLDDDVLTLADVVACLDVLMAR